jgi:hypothetical protein
MTFLVSTSPHSERCLDANDTPIATQHAPRLLQFISACLVVAVLNRIGLYDGERT